MARSHFHQTPLPIASHIQTWPTWATSSAAFLSSIREIRITSTHMASGTPVTKWAAGAATS
eukprot:2913293-Prymnesium_polylepis.2